MIYRTQYGLRLEEGSYNQVLTNSLTLNTEGAIYLDRQGGSSAMVAYNHVYTNGGGAAYHGGIFVLGDLPTIKRNVVLDVITDAVSIDASAASNPIQYNALCATTGNGVELRNNGSSVTAPNNWWGTNTPVSGTTYLGPVVLSDPIVLSVTLGANRLPADASATTIVTVTLRDSLGNTVPKPNRSGDPDARRIALQTTLGSLNPVVVDVNDQGVATTVLTAIPQIGTGVITATAFCDYPLTTTFELTNTNVAIAKTSLVTETMAGSLLTYTIAYSNPSSIDAPHVVITDVLGSNLAYVGDTSGYPANVAGNIVTWTIGALPSGTNRNFVLTTTVLANATSCVQPINNTALIGTSALESTYADNTANAAAINVLCANVAVTKTATVLSVFIGNNITYTITYSNSTAPAPNVIITDVLPAGTVYVSDTSGLTPTITGNQIVWLVGNLTPGVLRSFILIVSQPVTATNCVRLDRNTVLIGTTAIESSYADNTAFANFIDVICADWALVKTADRPSGPPNSPIDYTITYTNRSNYWLSGAIITDVLPANTSYVSDTSGLPLLNSGGLLTWTLLPLPPTTSVSFTLRLAYSGAGNNTTVTNTACISSILFDSDLSNNCASASYLVTNPVDVVVVKDDDVGPTTSLSRSSGHKASAYSFIAKTVLAPTVHRDFVYEGDVVTYTIAVVNVGTYTATNVILTETLPLFTTYLGSGWTQINSRTFITALNSLAPGAGRIVYFVVRVQDPIPPGVSNLVNYVCGYSSDQDMNPDDNCHYEDTPVVGRPLRVSKSAPQCLAPGSDFNYTINFANRSNAAFSQVAITDTLPTDTAYTGSTDWSCTAGTCTQIVPSLPPISSGTSILPVRLSSTFPYTTQSIVTNTVAISGGYQFVLTSTVDGGPNLAVVKNDNVGPLPLNQQPKWQQLERRFVGAARIPAYREFVLPGEWITYTILYVNTGIGTAHNVILTETLPLFTTYLGGDWTSIDGRHYTIALGDLAPGQGGLRHFIVKVDKPFPLGVDRVINRIDIGSREAECDVSDNWSADDTPVRNGQMRVFLPLILHQAGDNVVPPPEVSFTSATYHIFEDQPTALITVTLNKPWTDTVTVKYHTEDGSATAGQDYTATQGTLTFAPGETTHTFAVGIISDTLLEYWETVDLILSDPSLNAKIGYPGVATLYIEDVHCVVPTQSLVSVYSPMDVAYDAPTDRLFIANRDGPFGGSLKIGAITPTAYISQSLDGLLSAQGVALDTTHHKLYVVGWDWLNVLDSEGYTQTAKIALGTGVGAHAVAYNPVSQKIYVTGYSDNSITIIDANTLQIRARLSDSSQHSIYEPSYIAVNTNTGKVYVTNHAHGRPIGWVTVISGSADQIVNTIYLDPAGELYGISADNVHNRLYVASINAAVVYAIDATTDTQLGYLQVRRWSDNLPVPIRMIAVNANPGLGSKIRLWLTSSSTEDNGLDNIISLTGDWPYMEQPYLGVNLPPSPERGLKFDPTTKAVIVASASSNRVTILWDTPATQQCLWPFIAPSGPERSERSGDLYTVVHDFNAK